MDAFKDEFLPNLVGASAYDKWKQANSGSNGDYTKWVKFRDAILAGGKPTPPTMATKNGKFLVAAGKLRMSVTDIGSAPATTTSPTGVSAVAGNRQITLTWTANPAIETVDEYQVYENGFPLVSIPATANPSYVVTVDHLAQQLVNGTTYYLRVSAHNSSGYGPWSAEVSATPVGAANRYLDINFAAGLYSGEGVSEVLEAYATDARLSSWGGLPANYYDNPGAFGYTPATSMTTDLAQRVHLFNPVSVGLPANPAGGNWASWQEIRSTDGQWQAGYNYAKSSLNITPSSTMWGPGGFQYGIERWFAFDILFPLSISGAASPGGAVSLEFNNAWNLTGGDIHGSASLDVAQPGFTRISPYGNSHPKFFIYSLTSNQNTIPYTDASLIQITDSGGTRISSSFNVWHEVVFGQKTAYDGTVGSSTGWVEVWFNGVQKMARTSMPQYQSGESGPYLQLQNYMQYPVTFISGATRSAVVYGGFRGGLTRPDVQTR